MKVTYTELKGKQEAGYGVTRWANAKEINASLKQLTDANIYSVPMDEYNKIVAEYYDKKCAKSKAITAQAKEHIPVQQAVPDVHGQSGRRVSDRH